jgi:ZIP family zinc transporter
MPLWARAGSWGLVAVGASAAGAILAVLVDTMIPEAFEVAHDVAGLITVAGFRAAYALGRFGG